MAKDKKMKNDKSQQVSTPPSGIRIIFREILRDKAALTAFCIVIAILLVCFVGSLFLNKSQVTEINIAESYYAWGENGHLLGTDEGGRDILQLLIMGGRNSIMIGISVTLISMVVGLIVGIFAGYYGGVIDAIIMRIVDFIQIMPSFPILIVLATVTPNYNAYTLVGMISLFGWTASARYYRSFVLAQREREYVMASKTSGSSDLQIMFREVLPNISSMIIIDLVLGIAGNIGVETGLSFIGYGLPITTPSLGTLIGYATDPVNVTTRPWLWLPAALLLLVISLSINYVGRALQKAGDARQREN